jgi:hypothetical protein
VADSAAVTRDLAPTGPLRAAINLANPVCTPHGRDAGQRYLDDFVADLERTGFLARALVRNDPPQAVIAP